MEGEVVVLPDLADSAAFEAWLLQARGKFVAVSFAEPTCRPDESWQEWARPETFEQMHSSRDEADPPADVFSALRRSPEEFVREMRLAAAMR